MEMQIKTKGANQTAAQEKVHVTFQDDDEFKAVIESKQHNVKRSPTKGNPATQIDTYIDNVAFCDASGPLFHIHVVKEEHYDSYGDELYHCRCDLQLEDKNANTLQLSAKRMRLLVAFLQEYYPVTFSEHIVRDMKQDVYFDQGYWDLRREMKTNSAHVTLVTQLLYRLNQLREKRERGLLAHMEWEEKKFLEKIRPVPSISQHMELEYGEQDDIDTRIAKYAKEVKAEEEH